MFQSQNNKLKLFNQNVFNLFMNNKSKLSEKEIKFVRI
jgi:uncharacterized protein YecA (UPF0149 family)